MPGVKTKVRSYFSGRRKRYTDEGYNLDLTYITERVIAMGFPSVNLESIYRNSIVDVSRFMEEKHGKHYLIFNLSDREYDTSYFGDKVIVCGFADHHSPSLSLMWSIYSMIDLWLALDEENVVAAHCLAGKGRTGIVICCTLLMQGYFNKLGEKTTTEYVNAAVNWFGRKRGDGVENPDQIKFIRDFLVSTDTIGDISQLQAKSCLFPSLILGSLILYNIPVGVGGTNTLSLVVKLKVRNEWHTVYNSAWCYYPLLSHSSYQRQIVIDINALARGDLLFLLKNEKKVILHFSINTSEVPCCTKTNFTSLYFTKDNLSIDKGNSLPLTKSFACQLICLEQASFEDNTQQQRLDAIHALTGQAIEEERTRRDLLLRIRSSTEERSLRSVASQYHDLLTIDSSHPSSATATTTTTTTHSPTTTHTSSFTTPPPVSTLGLTSTSTVAGDIDQPCTPVLVQPSTPSSSLSSPPPSFFPPSPLSPFSRPQLRPDSTSSTISTSSASTTTTMTAIGGPRTAPVSPLRLNPHLPTICTEPLEPVASQAWLENSLNEDTPSNIGIGVDTDMNLNQDLECGSECGMVDLDEISLTALQDDEQARINQLALSRSLQIPLPSLPNDHLHETMDSSYGGSEDGREKGKHETLHRRYGSEGDSLAYTVGNRTVVARMRKPASHSVANPYADKFAQRIPYIAQISLSYGRDECTEFELSVTRAPQKEKGKKRSLTLQEKDILSKEDEAFTACSLEDQAIRIYASYCDNYFQAHSSLSTSLASATNATNATNIPTNTTKSPSDMPLQSLLQKFPPGTPIPLPAKGETVHATISQSLKLKLFAYVYEKHTWKRRLLLLTDRMMLVMKRPDDHYLKNAVMWMECGQAVGVVGDILDQQNCKWTVSLPRKNSPNILLRFTNFSELATFIGVSRHLSNYPTCEPSTPTATPTTPIPTLTNPDLYRDIYSLLYLFYPDRLHDTKGLYTRCMAIPTAFNEWTQEMFHLPESFCRNIQVPDKVKEVEELVTQDMDVSSAELYLQPGYMDVREIPQVVMDTVEQFRSSDIKPEIFNRLVQICQFTYPSPQPLVHAILNLKNEEWSALFNKYPNEFLRALRESPAKSS